MSRPRPEASATIGIFGIAAAFQLEEQELSSERLGAGTTTRLIFWESAEGGAGVLRRLVEEPGAMARVALAALEICHFDAEGAEHSHAGECARACYRCLLSYSNQPDHALLDRRLVRDLLVELSRAEVIAQAPPPSSVTPPTVPAAVAPPPAAAPTLSDAAMTTHEAVLPELTPTLPPAVDRVIAAIRALGGRDPEGILPEVIGHRPHLAYHPTYFILCPEPGESVAEMRADLEDAGCLVIVVDPDRDVGPQLEPYRFWRA